MNTISKAAGYVLIFLGIQFATNLLIQAACKLIAGDAYSQMSSMITLVTLLTFSIVSIGIFTLSGWAPVSRRFILSRPWGILFWSFVASLGAIIPSMFVQELMPEWPEAIKEYIEQAELVAMEVLHMRGGYLAICILAPVAEELVFRGAVLHTLLQWKPRQRWFMITLSALFFALAHLNPAQLFHPFLMGLLLGWMYERTGSVLPGIVYHCSNNTVAYLFAHAFPAPDIQLSDIFGTSVNVALSLLFSLLIIGPALFQLNQTMKKE